MHVDQILIAGSIILMTAGIAFSFFTMLPSVLISWSGLFFCFCTERFTFSYWILIGTGLLMILISGCETWYAASFRKKNQNKTQIDRHHWLVIVLHRFFIELLFAGIFLYFILH